MRKTDDRRRLDDRGEYRVVFQGQLMPGSYVQDRAAAQGLIRIMTWYAKDNAPLGYKVAGEIRACNPGEPQVLIALYTLYETGRIVRHTLATNRRQTVCWGTETT